MKSFCFTVDDNIRFFKELTFGEYNSLFDHPYLAMYARLHASYGLKVQLNLFYQTDGFDLSMMTEKYRQEWEQNASWLKLSFHSLYENENPYLTAKYSEVYTDCERVHREIVRFAGEASLADTTTVHYCQTTTDGLCALKDNGVKGLLGLFGTEEASMTSYSIPTSYGKALRQGEVLTYNGVDVAAIDLILNQINAKRISDAIQPFWGRNHIRLMIHEQYFYEDYPAYQPDFEQKLATAFEQMKQNDYCSVFFEEQL